MSKKNLGLIDTNIIIRFLIGDHPELYENAFAIFTAIETDATPILILESVFAETVYVLQ